MPFTSHECDDRNEVILTEEWRTGNDGALSLIKTLTPKHRDMVGHRDIESKRKGCPYPQRQLVTGAEEKVHEGRHERRVKAVHGGYVGQERVAHPHRDAHDALDVRRTRRFRVRVSFGFRASFRVIYIYIYKLFEVCVNAVSLVSLEAFMFYTSPDHPIVAFIRQGLGLGLPSSDKHQESTSSTQTQPLTSARPAAKSEGKSSLL